MKSIPAMDFRFALPVKSRQFAVDTGTASSLHVKYMLEWLTLQTVKTSIVGESHDVFERNRKWLTCCCFCRLVLLAPEAVASLPSCLICNCAAANSCVCCALLASKAAYACTVDTHACCCWQSEQMDVAWQGPCVNSCTGTLRRQAMTPGNKKLYTEHGIQLVWT